MIWVCLMMAPIAFVLSLPLCAALLRGGQWLGLHDEVGTEAHKKHERAVPNTGGIAIFMSVALPMAAGLLGVWLLPDAWWAQWPETVTQHLPGLRSMTAMGGGVLAAMATLHLMGLIDDRKPLGPFTKMWVELIVVTALVLFGDMRVLVFLGEPDAWGLLGNVVSLAVSVAWFIVIINAFNFLDNMDGLSGGVAAIIAGLYLAATLIGGQWFVAAMAGLLLGALLGFLVFNFPPARVFMGDGGSLLIGLLLAVISIRTTYFEAGVPADRTAQWYGLLTPLMVMAVPLYDFTSVTLIRLLQGRSPFRGDQSHFSHRLVRLGLSKRRAVGVIWLCTVATGLSGVMISSLNQWQALVAAGQTVAVLILLAVLEHGAAKRISDV